MNKLRVAVVGMLLPFLANAQERGADSIFRSHQKYYVVAAVLTLIFLGIAVFLLSVEKRLKQLEQ